MAYRFNDGNGAVTCDECDIIFKDNLSHEEYEERHGEGPDYCWKHEDRKLKKDVASSKDAV